MQRPSMPVRKRAISLSGAGRKVNECVSKVRKLRRHTRPDVGDQRRGLFCSASAHQGRTRYAHHAGRRRRPLGLPPLRHTKLPPLRSRPFHEYDAVRARAIRSCYSTAPRPRHVGYRRPRAHAAALNLCSTRRHRLPNAPPRKPTAWPLRLPDASRYAPPPGRRPSPPSRSCRRKLRAAAAFHYIKFGTARRWAASNDVHFELREDPLLSEALKVSSNCARYRVSRRSPRPANCSTTVAHGRGHSARKSCAPADRKAIHAARRPAEERAGRPPLAERLIFMARQSFGPQS